MKQIITQSITGILVVCVAGLLTGCAPSGDLSAFLKPYETQTSTNTYLLQPPDQVTVQCARIAEIHGKIQQIRPDGKVSFEGLGELDAAGKTPAQLAEDIRKRAETLYSIKGDYPIDVQVAKYGSGNYFVLGQVLMPGPKIFTGRDTFLTAIANARVIETSWLEKIRIIRPVPDGSQEANIIEVNLKKMMRDGKMEKNVLLQEGDIVYVPATPLSAVALVIAEFVRPIGQAMMPISQYYMMQSYAGR